MPESPYPDVPADSDGFDAIVRSLSESDESHRTKAVALAALSRREWQLAREAEEVPGEADFGKFAEVAAEEFGAVADAAGGDDA